MVGPKSHSRPTDDHASGTPTPHRSTPPDVSPIERGLRGLRRLARSMLALDAVALVALGLIGAALAVALFDYLFIAPAPLRWSTWVLGVLGAVVALRRLLLPAIQFRPHLSDLALRIENSPEGRRAGLHGVLASGLEFASADAPANPIEAALAAGISADAAQRFSPRLVLPVLRPRRPALRAAAVAGAAALLAAAWALWPATMSIGATRVLAPWADASWPTRTALADATEPGAHDIGRPLPLEADLLRTDRDPGQTRVWANYRLRIADAAGPTRRVALVWQPHREGPAGGDRPERYAWLHADLAGEADDLAAASGLGGRPVEFEVEYWFQTSDAATDPARVLIVEPPMVVSASLTVTPPAYTARAEGAGLSYLSGPIDLGPGTDDRARVGPILEGSRVELAITFNKPLGQTYASPQSILDGFGLPLAAHGASARIEGGTYTLTAVLDSPADEPRATEAAGPRQPTTIEIPIRVSDRHGLRSERESMFRLTVNPDLPPSASVTDPAADESVLPTAVIELAGEGADDVGIAQVSLERQRAAVPAGSSGAGPEPVGAAHTIVESGPLDAPVRQRSVRATLDLSVLGLRVGDELWITARASDVFALGDRRHAPAVSAPRRLRIISETELIDQVRRDLAGVREAAVRLDDAQSRLSASVAASGATEQTARSQAGVTGSIEDQSRYLDRIAARLERNRLEDPSLRALIEDVSEALDAGARASASASARLDEAVRAADPTTPEPESGSPSDERAGREEQARSDIREDQRAVRDELQRIAAMLDRGTDGWLVRREIERLLEQQQALIQQTRQAGEATAGRTVESLTPEERTELERIAQRQFELAQQAAQAIDELSQRARDLQQADPAQSAGMRSAAQTGRERQVGQNMEQAAEQVSRNNTGAAAQQQQEAADAMREMLDDLEQGRLGRDQTLQRVLAGVVASLDALIAEQELQLARLTEARAGIHAAPTPADLARAMIALHQNTLALTDHIRAGYPELQSVARLTSSAATAQGDAILAIRADPPELAEADRAETISLTRLREARAEARRLEEEAARRENARKRRELRQAYRAALERQVALRSDVGPYVGLELTRRHRAEVRTLGEAQESLRTDIDAILKQTKELAEAPVFTLAHARIDALLRRAADPLREGRAESPVLTRQQNAVEILQTLVMALDDTAPEQNPFDQASAGGGSGSGGGGGEEPPVIMPVYELRLLRGMQAQALGLTRDLDAEGPRAHPADIEELGSLQKLLADEAAALIQRMRTAPAGPASTPGDRQ